MHAASAVRVKKSLASLNRLKGKSFLTTEELTWEEWQSLFELARLSKEKGPAILGEPLTKKFFALIFYNPSFRTRISMTVAVSQLGGQVIPLEVGKGTWDLEHQLGAVMDGTKSEHINEAARVLSQYVDGIGVRCFPEQKDFQIDSQDDVLRKIVEYSRVPVINMESAFWHPLQALADMFTIFEVKGGFKRRKVVLSWANHPKALPHAVPHSFAVASAQCGLDLWVVAPEGYLLCEEVQKKCRAYAQVMGGEVVFTHDRQKAYDGADIIYAKSWASLKHYGKPELECRLDLKDWMIDDTVMSKTRQGHFMHCLPVRRNVVVTDSVLDSMSSIVTQQAANRLHMQRALLASIWSQDQ